MNSKAIYISLLMFFGFSCDNSKAHKESDVSVSEPVRGVWLTNIASDALTSTQKIQETVDLCESLGFNHIFVVTWNDATTTYPSEIMKNLTGVSINPEFKDRDPLKELIAAAHKKGIMVHAWFEFGFSCSYQKEDGGQIILKKPHWAAKDKTGKLVSKNGFQWMNAFDPEVQNFITSLVLEVVKNYDIDGIQGDDRLPALPSLGGYEDYTLALYKRENGDKLPPTDEKNYEWIKWRSSKLTDFLKELVLKIKKENPEIIISMAPSIFPWSEAEYLQDWPTWVNLGVIDWIIPQVYRYSIDKYSYEMDEIVNRHLDKSNKHKLFPGILLQVDKYNPSEGMLDSMISVNRSFGVEGEVFFFYEGIKKFQDYFKQKYKPSK